MAATGYSEMESIRQTGTISEYCNVFQDWFERVQILEGFSDFYGVYLFICGLKSEIREIFDDWHQYSCNMVEDVISLALKVDANGLQDSFSPFDPESSFYIKDLLFDYRKSLDEIMEGNESFKNGKIQEISNGKIDDIQGLLDDNKYEVKSENIDNAHKMFDKMPMKEILTHDGMAEKYGEVLYFSFVEPKDLMGEMGNNMELLNSEKERQKGANNVANLEPKDVRMEWGSLETQKVRDIYEVESDIYICKTLLSEKFEQKVVIQEIDDYTKNITSMVNHNVSVEMNASSVSVSRHFMTEIGVVNQDVLDIVSCGEIIEIGSFGDIEFYVCNFWGQKYLNEGVLGRKMVMELFGWKPGWLHSVINVRTVTLLKNGMNLFSDEFLGCQDNNRKINSFAWKPGWNICKKEGTRGISFDDRLEFGICLGRICELVERRHDTLKKHTLRLFHSNSMLWVFVKGWSRYKGGFTNELSEKTQVSFVDGNSNPNNTSCVGSECWLTVKDEELKWFKGNKLLTEMLLSNNYMAGTYNTEGEFVPLNKSLFEYSLLRINAEYELAGSSAGLKKSDGRRNWIISDQNGVTTSINLQQITYISPGVNPLKPTHISYFNQKPQNNLNHELLEFVWVELLENNKLVTAAEWAQMFFGSVPLKRSCSHLLLSKEVNFTMLDNKGSYVIYGPRTTVQIQEMKRKLLDEEIDEKNWHKIEFHEAHIIEACEGDVQKNTVGVILKFKILKFNICINYPLDKDEREDMAHLKEYAMVVDEAHEFNDALSAKKLQDGCIKVSIHVTDPVSLLFQFGKRVLLFIPIVCMKPAINLIYARVYADQISRLGIYCEAAAHDGFDKDRVLEDNIDEEVDLDTYISVNLIEKSTVEVQYNQCQISPPTVNDVTQGKSNLLKVEGSLPGAGLDYFQMAAVAMESLLYAPHPTIDVNADEGLKKKAMEKKCEQLARLKEGSESTTARFQNPRGALVPLVLSAQVTFERLQISRKFMMTWASLTSGSNKAVMEAFSSFLYMWLLELDALCQCWLWQLVMREPIFEGKNSIRGRYCYISKYRLAISVVNDIGGAESVKIGKKCVSRLLYTIYTDTYVNKDLDLI